MGGNKGSKKMGKWRNYIMMLQLKNKLLYKKELSVLSMVICTCNPSVGQADM